MRADRLVSLVLVLHARGRVTARELAGELGVSVRTIYRDLEALSTAGVPVMAEPGPGGGCQLLEGYRFPLRALRPEEAEALLVLGVPGVLRELGLGGLVPAAHRQGRGSAGPGSGQPGRGRPLVHLDMPGWFRSPEQVPQLRTLAEALRQHRQLAIGYRRGDGAGDRAPRVVSPLGLVNKAGVWYLVALTRRAQVMVLRAGRVTSARVLAGSAARPDGFDLAGFWQRWSQEFTASRPRLAVRLRASPLALTVFPEVFGDEVRHAISAARPPGEQGWRELTLSFEHERAAAHRLAGFGDQVEVLAPARVRKLLLAAARGILDRYGGE